MLRRPTDYPSRFIAEIFSSAFLCLMLLLAACSPIMRTSSPTASLDPTQSPTQTMLPSPTNTEMPPTATATTIPTEVPPSPTVPLMNTPIVLASQAVNHPTATYVCPWAEVAQSVPVYTYQVVNSYHHDPAAYTQGLIYRDGLLFEGTGLYGPSSLRRVELESGEVQQMVELPQPYFGEGITELGGVIYQLTWTNQIGFIYDVATFERLNTFDYSTEGWGLTHDGKNLIMSDGSPNLYFLDPQTLQPTSQVMVTAENIPVPRLNELEYVDGQVWSNVYQTSCIARIDPSNGQVVGWIDISGILALKDLSGTEGPNGITYHPEVPNGIAYDAVGKRIFVTGKLWPLLFEIKLLNK